MNSIQFWRHVQRKQLLQTRSKAKTSVMHGGPCTSAAVNSPTATVFTNLVSDSRKRHVPGSESPKRYTYHQSLVLSRALPVGSYPKTYFEATKMLCALHPTQSYYSDGTASTRDSENSLRGGTRRLPQYVTQSLQLTSIKRNLSPIPQHLTILAVSSRPCPTRPAVASQPTALTLPPPPPPPTRTTTTYAIPKVTSSTRTQRQQDPWRTLSHMELPTTPALCTQTMDKVYFKQSDGVPHARQPTWRHVRPTCITKCTVCLSLRKPWTAPEPQGTRGGGATGTNPRHAPSPDIQHSPSNQLPFVSKRQTRRSSSCPLTWQLIPCCACCRPF